MAFGVGRAKLLMYQCVNFDVDVIRSLRIKYTSFCSDSPVF